MWQKRDRYVIMIKYRSSSDPLFSMGQPEYMINALTGSFIVISAGKPPKFKQVTHYTLCSLLLSKARL